MDIVYSSRNLIHIEIHEGLMNFRGFISFIYGSPMARDRPIFWDEMKAKESEEGKLWPCVGDFNVMVG